MEKLFLEFRRKINRDEDFSKLDIFKGKNISIAATIQYIDLIPPIREYLEKNKNKVLLKKGSFYEGHVIGCDPSAFNLKADILILITDGKFHGMNNALILDREIFVFNLNKLEKISLEDLKKQKQKTKAKKVKFLSSDKIGLIVSTKPGQSLKSFEKVAKNIEKLKKEVYVFETNNINFSELENFPDIQIWVNTACYGLGLDDPRIVNLQDIIELI
jgi:diphthamide biosynthesis enzyme Dph1/Dph2-like protein